MILKENKISHIGSTQLFTKVSHFNYNMANNKSVKNIFAIETDNCKFKSETRSTC
jgi:hypothetical protein